MAAKPPRRLTKHSKDRWPRGDQHDEQSAYADLLRHRRLREERANAGHRHFQFLFADSLLNDFCFYLQATFVAAVPMLVAAVPRSILAPCKDGATVFSPPL